MSEQPSAENDAPEVREGARLFCTYCGEWGHLNTPCPTGVIPPAATDAEAGR